MKLNNRGFSLVEIMIAAAMLGAISMGVMSLIKNMRKGEVVSETRMEELELRRLITTLLTDQQACKNTFIGTNIGSTIAQIKNSAGNVLYQTNNIYGNNTVKITAMSTQDMGIVNSDNTRVVNLNITLQKINQMAGGTSKVTSIQLNVAAPSANGAITNCGVDTNQIISAANIATCTSLSGFWNPATSTCSIDYFVKKAGDIMTGDLITTKITAAQFCTGPNCKAIGDLALSNQACPNGQAQIGVKVDGTPNCKALQCPASQYFAGLDNNSNPICRPYPTNTCPTNQYVSKVNADGTVQCDIIPNTATSTCPPGQVLQSINAGVPTCVNKGAATTCAAGQVVSAVAADGSVTCTNKGAGATCPVGQYVTSVSINGTITCSAPLACPGAFINMYRCPGVVSLGGGAWGYYGCQNQITNQSTCYEIEFPTTRSFPCTYVGKMCLY